MPTFRKKRAASAGSARSPEPDNNRDNVRRYYAKGSRIPYEKNDRKADRSQSPAPTTEHIPAISPPNRLMSRTPSGLRLHQEKQTRARSLPAAGRSKLRSNGHHSHSNNNRHHSHGLRLTGERKHDDGRKKRGLSTKLFAKLSRRMGGLQVGTAPTPAAAVRTAAVRETFGTKVSKVPLEPWGLPSTSPTSTSPTSSSTLNHINDSDVLAARIVQKQSPTRLHVQARSEVDERERELRERLEKKAQTLQLSTTNLTIPDINARQRQLLFHKSMHGAFATGSRGLDPLADRRRMRLGITGTHVHRAKRVKRIVVGLVPGSAAALREKKRQETETTATPRMYESPKQRRHRLREKIVSVMDRIHAANVPIVSAGACRYDLGEKRVISDNKDRCTIQVGHMSVGTEEGNTHSVEVVIKNQIVSSDRDDFEEALEDFCIECVTGWAVSKFKDYWEASYYNKDKEEEDNGSSSSDSETEGKGDNIFLALAEGVDHDGRKDSSAGGFGKFTSGAKRGHSRMMSAVTTTNTALTEYFMGCNSQTLLTLIQHARRWTNSLIASAKKTRINTTFAAAIQKITPQKEGEETTSDGKPAVDPDVQRYNLLIVMQFSRPAFPPNYADNKRLSMDLADWIQADSFWRCIRENDVDTGERAVSRISFLDDEGNTFIYNMEESMKNYLCMELARALVELWRTGYLHCDIKPANFIVCANQYASIANQRGRGRSGKRFASNSKNIKLKLIDFGEGGRQSEIQGIIAGTDWYMAPEMRDYGTPSIQSEVYSTGVTMIEIWYGELWDGSRTPEACLLDAVTKISARNTIVGQFLQRCLCKDPEGRPYPYDLYTFFAAQCQASSRIVIKGDTGSSGTAGERESLEEHEKKILEMEAKQQLMREAERDLSLQQRREEQRRDEQSRRRRMQKRERERPRSYGGGQDGSGG